MTQHERLTDEQVAQILSWIALPVDPWVLRALAREVIESRRLAPMHAADDALYAAAKAWGGCACHVDEDEPYCKHYDLFRAAQDKSRAARRALEPQPDEAERIVAALEKAGWKLTLEGTALSPQDTIRAALGRTGK